MDAPQQQFTLDLSAGIYIKGIQLSENSFLATTNFGQLEAVMRDPRDLQPNARRSGYEAERLEEEAAIHELIQRALTGAKKSNVPKYAQYIRDLVVGHIVGVLPPTHTWSHDQLEVVSPPGGRDTYILLPQGQKLLAIDGETQVTGHFVVAGEEASPEIKTAHRKFPLAMVIHHGIPTNAARQFFHDLNILAVRPNTSLGLSMDTKDPLMKIVGDIETKVPFLTGAVDKQARQLPKRSKKKMTVQSLRQFVVNTKFGMAGVQYGSKPAPIDDQDIEELEKVARDWIELYLNTFAAAVVDRENCLAGSAPVLAAVGAIGKGILDADEWDRTRVMRDAIESLKAVDWSKGEHWAGVAGKFTAKGAFSVGGTKEVGYAVYNVLTDKSNPGFARVRSSVAVPQVSEVPQEVMS
ncbi:hypothetical protein DSM104299_05470 [Baekduia alba]|uniref:DNA sulfur modification protein DndB n=1 Tax=Baekduia alba TaxID=2997333 RepID=UPI00233FA3CB|nr:DNA sulfur modification protein DndB [Baekduia alba]WCB96704.1 hypothetical protein DSM104299_05470 [Baekduia alba]